MHTTVKFPLTAIDLLQATVSVAIALFEHWTTRIRVGCSSFRLLHINLSPLCRSRIHLSPSPPRNHVLHSLIEKYFPQRYDFFYVTLLLIDRLEERRNERRVRTDVTPDRVPLFILDHVMFPGDTTRLYVFEVRYRLMIRRVLEGGRQFGIILNLPDLVGHCGVMVLIQNHIQLCTFPSSFGIRSIQADGKFIVHVIAQKRFLVKSVDMMDGYSVARTSDIFDADHASSTSTPDSFPSDESGLHFRGNSNSDPGHQSPSNLASTIEAVKAAILLSRQSWFPFSRSAIGVIPSEPSEFTMWAASHMYTNLPTKQMVSPRRFSPLFFTILALRNG